MHVPAEDQQRRAMRLSQKGGEFVSLSPSSRNLSKTPLGNMGRSFASASVIHNAILYGICTVKSYAHMIATGGIRVGRDTRPEPFGAFRRFHTNVCNLPSSKMLLKTCLSTLPEPPRGRLFASTNCLGAL